MDKALLELRKAFPWPRHKPEGIERHWGWISRVTKHAMHTILQQNNITPSGTVLELGVLYGKSARWWLRQKFTHIICNDLFQYKHAKGTHKRDFIHSNWDMRNKFTILPMGSQSALATVRAFEVPVQVVYIDACHEFGDAAADTLLAYQLFYGRAFIIGDDWRFVEDAIQWAAKTAGFQVGVIKNSWWIK